MRTLVIYYSRTGTTARVARELRDLLNCDLLEVKDRKDRGGAIGYVVACKDAAMKRPTDIAPLNVDLTGYDLLIFGTPVWAFTMAPAVRTAMEAAPAGAKVALFCTMNSSGQNRTFADMAGLCATAPLATLALTRKQVLSGDLTALLAPFAAALR